MLQAGGAFLYPLRRNGITKAPDKVGDFFYFSFEMTLVMGRKNTETVTAVQAS